MIQGEVMAKRKPHDNDLQLPELPKAEINRRLGIDPLRLLNARNMERIRNRHENYKTRIPYAPQPWFFVDGGTVGIFDGEELVQGGWFQGKFDSYYVHSWDLAQLYPSATKCLEAAIRISNETGVHCQAMGLPHAAYSPSDEGSWWLDMHHTQHYLDLAVLRINRRHQAGINPMRLSDWIKQGYMPAGQGYDPSKICFWNWNAIVAFFKRMEREYKKRKRTNTRRT
jgi:hypothetical protein